MTGTAPANRDTLYELSPTHGSRNTPAQLTVTNVLTSPPIDADTGSISDEVVIAVLVAKPLLTVQIDAVAVENAVVIGVDTSDALVGSCAK